MTFKNGNFYISDKERFGRPTAVKEDEKMGKSYGKRRKILRLIYIVLIFFYYNKKNNEKSARTFALL